MNSYQEHFKGKKITVMGLGLLGRGVGDAKFLAEQGAELIVTDLKTETELASSLEQLKEFSNITYRLGEHRVDDFKDRDFILKAAGVPLDSPYVEEAKGNTIPIKMSASWFTELTNIPVIGITGTRGKSTTTHMIHEILKEAGKHVLLGGNVRGVSTLALLPEVKEDSVAVMELDSWQCQGFGDAKISPDIAVFTTFMDDHLNYYKGDRDRYLEDKAQIFLYQKENDVLIASSQVASLLEEKYGSQIKSQLAVASPDKFPEGWQLQIPGEHNITNAVCAIGAVRALKIDYGAIQRALENFKGVPGRLELIREVNGVKIYNDTTATTPDAMATAVDALKDNGSIVLIAGGADKGIDTFKFIEAAQACKKVLLLSGTGTSRVQDDLPAAQVHDSIDSAVVDAVASAEAGDQILLSPGFASFGMFKNEFDRGDQFVSLVQKL